jgi:hypothetical protein
MASQFRNRIGTTQEAANSSTHPGQITADKAQRELCFAWEIMLLKVECLPNSRLPVKKDFTLNARCHKENLKWLQENFEVERPSTTKYTVVEGDLLTYDNLQIIAHVSDCTALINYGLSAQISINLGCDAAANRKPDPHSRYRACASTKSVPGTAIFRKSRDGSLIVAHLYAFEEFGVDHKEENYVHRIQWFKMCLDALAEFIISNKLKRLGIPFGMGRCMANGDWTRCQQVINQWCEQHSDEFQVFVVLKS